MQAAATPGPNLSTTLVGAGNAAGLFPVITPAPTPSPGHPARHQPGRRTQRHPAGQAVGVVAPSAPRNAGPGAHRPGGRLPAGHDPAVRAQAAKDTARVVPQITPAPTPSPGPASTNPAAERNVSPAGRAEDVSTQRARNAGPGAHCPRGRLPAGNDPAVRAQAEKQTRTRSLALFAERGGGGFGGPGQGVPDTGQGPLRDPQGPGSRS